MYYYCKSPINNRTLERCLKKYKPSPTQYVMKMKRQKMVINCLAFILLIKLLE